MKDFMIEWGGSVCLVVILVVFMICATIVLATNPEIAASFFAD